MHIKEVKTKEQFLLALTHIPDFCDPLQMLMADITKNPARRAEINRWVHELYWDDLINKTDQGMVKITQEGKHLAFRYSLSLLPEMETEDFINNILALCASRPDAHKALMEGLAHL